MHNPKVISQVVENDLCIGCGLCAYACPSDALSMDWSSDGFIVATLSGECDDDNSCIKVCPFNPIPEKSVKNEAAIANIFLSEDTNIDEKLGRIIKTYVGYSNQFRETSSSGGIATYIFDQLLNKKVVDHIFCVESSSNTESHYHYHIINSPSELTASSKTKYYPVTLSSVFNEIDKLEGRVAIVGVACFIKAIRLTQYYEPTLRDKIPFTVGIICGGVKSKFFTEYLVSKAGSDPNDISYPQYRIKDPDSVALDYSFGFIDNQSQKPKRIKMRDVGDMWGTGLFKANACDFCDDVATELADISLGDAWIEPYKNDGLGHSVIITRSPLADKLIKQGIEQSEIYVKSVSPDLVKSSQQGSFNHRHDGLYVRLKEAKRKKILIAEKRHGQKPVSITIELLHRLRRLTRKRSLNVWKKHRNSVYFDHKMQPTLKLLKVVTKASHVERRLNKVIKRVLK